MHDMDYIHVCACASIYASVCVCVCSYACMCAHAEMINVFDLYNTHVLFIAVILCQA